MCSSFYFEMEKGRVIEVSELQSQRGKGNAWTKTVKFCGKCTDYHISRAKM